MNMSNLSTKERLAQALEALNDPRVKPLIARARDGDFDDYESHSATPQIDLVTELRKLGLTDFAARAMDGEFDGTKEEGEAWYEREGKHLFLSDKSVSALLHQASRKARKGRR